MSNRISNIVTMKIEYKTEEDNYVTISEIQEMYNKLLRFTYNRINKSEEKLSTKEITELQKNRNNIDKWENSFFRSSAIFDSKSLTNKKEKNKVIFGSKKNFLNRCQHKISKEEFLKNRLVPIYSIGEASRKGNRFFSILNSKNILFQPNRKTKIYLEMVSVGYKRVSVLNQLKHLQDNNIIPITYRLDKKYIYISYDYNLLVENKYKIKQNRTMSIDLNPNYIGWSVIDWNNDGENYHIVKSGSISLKTLNDYEKLLKLKSSHPKRKYVTNKRNHEVAEIAKFLFSQCKHYKCEAFGVEDLSIKPSDTKLGKKLNRLINNQWNRSLLIQQIKKRVKSSSTTLIEVKPEYSSYIGNILYRGEKLPDEVLSSIEIGRRTFEFFTQYIVKRRPNKKTVVFPELRSTTMNRVSISLEEIGVRVRMIDSWKLLCNKVKKSKKRYRFSREEALKIHSSCLLSKFYSKRFILFNYF